MDIDFIELELINYSIVDEHDLSLTEYEKRSRANERAHCETCNAFVSNKRAKESCGYDHEGEWYGPYCELGKGCNK